MCFNTVWLFRVIWQRCAQIFVGRFQMCSCVRSLDGSNNFHEWANKRTNVCIFVLRIHATIPLNQRYCHSNTPTQQYFAVNWLDYCQKVELLCKRNKTKGNKNLFQTNCIPLFERRNRINLHHSVTKCQRCESISLNNILIGAMWNFPVFDQKQRNLRFWYFALLMLFSIDAVA